MSRRLFRQSIFSSLTASAFFIAEGIPVYDLDQSQASIEEFESALLSTGPGIAVAVSPITAGKRYAASAASRRTVATVSITVVIKANLEHLTNPGDFLDAIDAAIAAIQGAHHNGANSVSYENDSLENDSSSVLTHYVTFSGNIDLTHPA